MRLFSEIEVNSSDKTFDPNTLNKHVKIEALLDVDHLHDKSDENLIEDVVELLKYLRSNTQSS